MVVALALGATTYAAVLRIGPAAVKSAPRPAIAVSAQVSGLLYPGSIRPLRLRVKNLTSRKLRALAINVKVGKPSGELPRMGGGRRALRAARHTPSPSHADHVGLVAHAPGLAQLLPGSADSVRRSPMTLDGHP